MRGVKEGWNLLQNHHSSGHKDSTAILRLQDSARAHRYCLQCTITVRLSEATDIMLLRNSHNLVFLTEALRK